MVASLQIKIIVEAERNKHKKERNMTEIVFQPQDNKKFDMIDTNMTCI